MTTIRKATEGDAEEIQLTFLRSLQEVCAKDHTPDELLAWSRRRHDEGQLMRDIRDGNVWVVELEGMIQGYAHLHLNKFYGRRLGQVHGLYLTPNAIGKGIGTQLARILIEEAKEFGAEEIRLESTLTAHAFYRNIGFEYDGDPTAVHLGGGRVRCIPMQMILGRGVQ